MTYSVDKQLVEYKKLIDNFLNDYIESQISRAKNLDASYELLWQSIHSLFNSGGKRFRPIMSLLSYEALGGIDKSNILSIVASQELLHLSLLIHDDIIDRDYIRYGINNISGQYQNRYLENIKDKSERLHYSDGAALLAGDLLISSSYQLLLANAEAKYFKELLSVFDDAIFYVAGGELIDTESAFISSNKSLLINELKTAHYSFVAPLKLGAILADATSEVIKSITELGVMLGTAYQLVDDDLGVFGDSSLTGKSNSSDLSQGKKTYMIEQFDELALEEHIKQFYSYFGKSNISPSQLDKLRSLLIESGARKANLNKINDLRSNAVSAVKSLDIKEENKKIFYELIRLTLDRNK